MSKAQGTIRSGIVPNATCSRGQAYAVPAMEPVETDAVASGGSESQLLSPKQRVVDARTGCGESVRGPVRPDHPINPLI